MSITYTPFLSPGWATIYAKYTLYDAWYSGDAERLARCYAEQIATPNNQRSLFWARSRKDEVSASVHAPVAGDIAATSAALLFSERPSIIIADAHIENAPADAIKTQDRLNALLAGECDYLPHCRFDAAAESAAAFGGVFLKINWAKALCSMPIISVVHADAALPEFSQGMLTACTFWTFDDAREERIEERYVKGAIITRRYMQA
jgi:hypothetical protein